MIANRKRLRIKDFDYSSKNYYFITICTDNRNCIFGNVNNLSKRGYIAESELMKISDHFPNVKVDKYIVMPNHIHAIIVIGCEECIVGNGLDRSETKGTVKTVPYKDRGPHQPVGNGLDHSKNLTLSHIIGLYK